MGRVSRYIPYQALKMELFAKYLVAISAKSSILCLKCVSNGSKYASASLENKQSFKQKGKWLTQKLLRKRLRSRFFLVKVPARSENSKNHLDKKKKMIFSITTDLFPKKCLRSIHFNFRYYVE